VPHRADPVLRDLLGRGPGIDAPRISPQRSLIYAMVGLPGRRIGQRWGPTRAPIQASKAERNEVGESQASFLCHFAFDPQAINPPRFGEALRLRNPTLRGTPWVSSNAEPGHGPASFRTPLRGLTVCDDPALLGLASAERTRPCHDIDTDAVRSVGARAPCTSGASSPPVRFSIPAGGECRCTRHASGHRDATHAGPTAPAGTARSCCPVW